MKLLRLLLLLCIPSFCYAQGAFVAPQVALNTVNGVTRPLAGATITVCAAAASGIPCTPATTAIYANIALTIPLSNPFTADANGNYSFAVAAGTYTVTVTAASFAGYSYQVTASAVTQAQGVPVPNINCNGTTDNTAVLNSFFATLGTSSTNVVHVQLPAGICMVSSNVQIPDYVFLQGAGKYATTIKQSNSTNSTNPILTFSGSSGGTNNGGTNVTFSDFTIDGNAANQTTGLRSVANTSGVVSKMFFYNMRFINAWQSAVLFYDFTSTGTNNDVGAWNSDFENNAPSQGSTLLDEECVVGDFTVFHALRFRMVNNRSEGTNGNFAAPCGGNTNNAGDIVIVGNVVHNAQGFGVALGNLSNNSVVSGNDFNQPTSRENIIDIGDGSYISVTGNTVVSGGSACSVTCGGVGDGPPALHVTITGNTILGNTSTNNVCMTLGSNDATISNNVCRLAGQGGILYAIPNNVAANNVTITGNTISDTGQAQAGHGGIEVFMATGGTAAISGLTITGNHCFDDQGTKTQSYGIALSVSGQTSGYGTYLIANNDLRGNLTGGMLDNSTQAGSGIGVTGNEHIIRDNPGYNLVTDSVIDLRAQTGNLFATAGVVPSQNVAMWQVCIYETLTQAATTSSTLPTVSIGWTDKITGNNGLVFNFTTNSPTGNSTNSYAAGCTTIVPSNGTNVNYSTGSYASSGATPMQYALRVQMKAFN